MLKVAVVCDSVLLKNSLEIFLRDRLSDFSNADVILTDRKFECEKPVLLVSNIADADIKKPFGKAKLLSILENFEKEMEVKKELFEPKQDVEVSKSFEEQIRELTKDFSERLIEIVNSHKG